MESIKSDTEGGFNAFIDRQRNEPGEAGVTLAQFDTEYEVVYANRPIADVYRGWICSRAARRRCYDSLGRLITDVGRRVGGAPRTARPGTVIVVVLTDGHENSSREWTHEAVNKAIKRQEAEYSLGLHLPRCEHGRRRGRHSSRASPPTAR